MAQTAVQAICVFLGAGAGALLRWRLGVWLAAWYPAFPLGTHAANLIGCFLIGIAAGCFEIRPGISPEARLLITTGFLGGFTTFSAFSLELAQLFSQRSILAAALVVAKVSACVLLTFAGMALARRLA